MDEPISAEVARISRRIRRWREQKQLTLQQLAERSDLATSTVQKVETGQMIPSVAVLLKLARGLGRRATELIHEGDQEQEVVRLSAAERGEIGMEGQLIVERLSSDLPSPALEMWRVTLYPGVSSGTDRIQYEGEELIVCEKGKVLFSVGDEEIELRTGDSLHFKASLPHAWRNESRSPVRFTITGTLPLQLRQAIRNRLAVASGRAG